MPVPPATVAVTRDPDPENAVHQALDIIAPTIPSRAIVDRVLIKPNILTMEFRANGLTNTNPVVCAAVARFFQERHGCAVILGEGTTSSREGPPDSLRAMENNHFTSQGVDWARADFNHDDDAAWFPIVSPGLAGQTVELSLARTAVITPLVSVAKLKTHDVLGLTLSLKNLMGTICRARDARTREILQEHTFVKAYMHGFGPKQPPKLTRAQNTGPSKVALAANLVRLALQNRPVVSVIEACPGMEGNGPTRGSPVPTNTIFASTDPLACDVVAARAAGFEIEDFQYLARLGALGYGATRPESIEITGDDPDVLANFPKFRPHEIYADAIFTDAEKDQLRRYTNL